MAAAAALWFKTSLLVSLLLIIPFSYGLGMVEGFQSGMQKAEYSVEQGGHGMIQMSPARKLLTMGTTLDYDDPGANPKHDPRKKPGKP